MFAFSGIPPKDTAFPVTRWTLIAALKSEEDGAPERALEELCRMYWYPVYAFVRQEGVSPEDAQDLTQGFFAKFLDREDFRSARQELGKLRTYLLAAVKHYLVQDWRQRTAQKRGGGAVLLSLDAAAAEQRYAMEPAHLASPDALFDRRWALDTMEEALRRVEQEYRAGGKAELHAALQPFISARSHQAQAAEIGARFGMTEGAVNVSIHRLRQRFRKCLEGLVAETVGTEGDPAGELRHLLNLLTQ